MVVGAGPAGLVAAITLARYGVECLIVDRRRAPGPLPRATVISTRTMELLRAWGLHDEVLRGGDDVEWLLLLCATLSEVAEGRAVEVGYPTRAQSALISPTAPACVPQDHLETVLLDHLRSLPSARVELGVSVEDVRPHRDGAHVVLRDLASGRTRTIAAQYVIGADGARSVVRERVGIPVRGVEHLIEALSVVVHAPLWDVVGAHRYGIYYVEHPGAEGTFLPAGQGDRWIYGFGWDPAREQIDDYPDDRLIERIRTAAGRADLEVRLGQLRSFSFAGSIADRFRHDRVFLVGDAAHRVTPRGGTGMNTAIAGGFDLGWKLGWVLKGWASDSFLDTYETDRRPVAEHNLARSLDPDGSQRGTLGELSIDLGGRIRHLWMDETVDGARASTLDLVGPGLTLVTGPGGTHRGADGAWPYRGAPVSTRSVDGIVARGLGILPGGGLLVRPDGVPVATWAGADVRRRATTSAWAAPAHQLLPAMELQR